MPDDSFSDSTPRESGAQGTPTEPHGPARHPPENADAPQEAQTRPREYGGRTGPDPVRYGDWEKSGRCIDF